MEFLISFYDNSLIYYPNIFFAVLFFISILGIVLVGIGLIVLGKKIIRVIEEIKSNLKQLRKIKREEGKKTSFVLMIKAFFQRKRVSLVYIAGALTVFFARMVQVAFIRINKALGHIELQTERIIKKIGKEIFIKE